ncbi:MAG: SPOR domain-containing protein [Azospirillaceae bacterium]|nr:SPOR domain-containing protein [Azospirillaceae bacterium]
MTISLGRWQTVGLVSGLMGLVLVALILGIALAASALRSSPADMAAGTGAAGALASLTPGSGGAAPAAPGPNLLGKVGSSVQSNLRATAAVKAAGLSRDSAGQTGRVLSSVTDPFTGAATGTARKFLPSWMQSYAGIVINKPVAVLRTTVSGNVASRVTGASQAVLDPQAVVNPTSSSLSSSPSAAPGAAASDVAAVAPFAETASRHYAVELGRFVSQANAEAFAADAARRGVSCRVEIVPAPGSSTLYAVRSRHFDDATTAADAVDAMRRQGIAGTVVTLAESGAS